MLFLQPKILCLKSFANREQRAVCSVQERRCYPLQGYMGEPVSAGSQENGSIFTDSLGTVGHMVGAAPGGRLSVWFGDLCHHAAFLCCWGSRWRELDWH